MKIAIVYYSKHHENTKKLLNKISSKYKVTLIDITKTSDFNLTDFDIIGFASGIYYSKFHKSILEFAKKNLPKNKSVFFIYTCGAKKEGYTKSIEDIVSEKSAKIKGTFGCLGLDTFGPFKLIGGIAKGHPNENDFDDVISFFDTIIN